MGYKLCMQPITSDAKFISVWRKLSSIIVEGDNDQSSYTVPLLQILALWASLLHAWHWWVVHRDIWERQEREDNSISEALGWFQWTFWKVRFTSVLLSKIGLPGWYLVHSVAVHKVLNVVINSKFQSGIAGDCIQLCILSLLLTDLWILKMLEEDNGTWVTSYNCHCLTFFSCSKELLMAMGRRRELTWGHHENRLFENHYLALPTCLKLCLTAYYLWSSCLTMWHSSLLRNNAAFFKW